MSQVDQLCDKAIASSREFLNQLIEGYSPRNFTIRFWDGSLLEPEPGADSRFTLELEHSGAVRQMFWPFNKANLGEAYIYNDFDIQGDIQAFFDLIQYLRQLRFSLGQRLKLFLKLLALPKGNQPRQGRQAVHLQGGKRSLDRDRQAIEYHYDDPPTEFFGLFLDPLFQYSCAYFSSPQEDLDAAQERKADYLCRKLRLQPGEKLIDFGCGWGGLITHAAKNYGVQAVGMSLSQRQVEWANQQIRQKGLQDHCRVEYMDYRQFPETELFDKAVSVGFCEHLGEKGMLQLFRKIWSLLRPGGVYLHHAITFRPFTRFPSWRAFALKYVFPDGELATIPRTLHRLAEAGFEIRDVESLREHYVYTLQNWLARLESNHEKVRQLTDEATYRVFRIYFAGSIQGFRLGLYNLYQTLVVKAGENVSGLPLTREDWYRNPNSL